MGINFGPPGKKMSKKEYVQFLLEMFKMPRTLRQKFLCRHEWEEHTIPISEGTSFEVLSLFRLCKKCSRFERVRINNGINQVAV